MSTLDPVSDADLRALLERTQAEFAVFRDRGLALDMIHDKPSPEQLDLYHAMLTLPGNGDWHSEAGEGARNYGGRQGLPEARVLRLRPRRPAGGVVVDENWPLALMHDAVAQAMLKGVPGSSLAWMKADAVSFLCTVRATTPTSRSWTSSAFAPSPCRFSGTVRTWPRSRSWCAIPP